MSILALTELELISCETKYSYPMHIIHGETLQIVNVPQMQSPLNRAAP